MHKARLHAKWNRYAVLFSGRLIVENSRDPEHDAARALVAMGVTGKLTLCDGKSGHPRTIIPDIEQAAGFSMSEESRDGFRLRPTWTRISLHPRLKRARLLSLGLRTPKRLLESPKVH